MLLQTAIVCLVVLAGQPGLVQQPTAQARNAPAAVLAQAPTVSARPSSVPAGGTIGVTWTGIGSPNSNDRIGVYQGSTDLNLWVYTDGRSGGQAAIPLPAALTPASNYSLRLYAAGGGLLATSPPFTVTAAVGGAPSSGPSVSARPDSVPVGGTVSATWTGIASPNVNDRVEVYAGPNPVNLRAYTDGRASGQAAIALTGVGEGSYNLRLFDDGGTLLATSGPFRIGPPPTPLPTSTPTPVPTQVASPTPAPGSCIPVEVPPAGTASNPPYINGGSVGGVHTLTGSYSYSHTDIAIAGVGPAPSFTRTYNANDSRSGSLGVGWTHNYAIRLVRPASSSNDIVLVGPQGRSDHYTYTGDPNGFWSPPAGVFTTLQKQTNGAFEAKALDQSRMTFNACGRLDAIIDRYGNSSDLTYDPVTGRLALIADPAGRGSLSLGYDANGRLTSVQDWSGRPAVTYEYDASGRLSKVHDRMTVPDGGNVTTFGYDAGSRLSTITDARTASPCPSTGCVVLTNTYYPSGQVHYQDDAAGQRTTFTYRTSPPGADVTFPATSYQATFQPTQSYTYDGNGWLTTEVTSPESGISYTVSHAYDATKGVRTSTTDARGATTTYCYDVSTAGTALGTRGLLTRVIAPSVFSSDIGANTRPTTLTEYDGLNRPTRVYSPKGVNTAAIPPTCSADYTAPNALDLAYATDKAYSGHNELTAVTRRYYSYDQNGNRTGAMQVATTKYEYSSTWPGQVTYETPPRGNPGPQPDHAYATAHTYYGPGDPQAGMRATTQPPAQTAVYMCYDAVGRLTAKSDGFVNACDSVRNQNHRWDYTYDNEDRLLSTTSPPTTFGQANTRLTTSSSYDAVGHQVTATDAVGNITRYTYDTRGQLFEVRQSKDFANPDNDSSPQITRYLYDGLGHRQWVYKLQGTQQLTQAQYRSDGLGRLREEIEYVTYPSSLTLTRTYGYDSNGNRTSQSNPNGGSISWGYDALDRPTTISYSPSASTPGVTYHYDRGGRRTQMITDTQGSSTYTYDERDALVRIETPYVGGSGTKVVRYGYDLDGNRAWLRYPRQPSQIEGDQLTYTRDVAGRITFLTDWLNRSTVYSYHPTDGKLTKQSNVTGTTKTPEYDNLRRLTGLAHNYSAGSAIAADSYLLDGNGSPYEIDGFAQNACPSPGCTPSATSYKHRYGYDHLNRLISFNDDDQVAALPSGISQHYDAAHNMSDFTLNFPPPTPGQTWTNTPNGADWLLAQTRSGAAGSFTYGYDNNGNQTSESNTIAYPQYTFSYAIADRPLTAASGVTTAYFTYDGDGVRVFKSVGSTHYLYVYDRSAKTPTLLEDGSRRYVSGPTGILYTTDITGGGNPQLIYHTDNQGSVRAITNYSAQLVYSTRYEPYGNLRHTASVAGFAAQPLGYTGAPFDPEGAVIYLNARYYAPGEARFIQRDSVFGSDTDPVSLNRYVYARDNPMVFTDPSGRQACPSLFSLAACGPYLGLDPYHPDFAHAYGELAGPCNLFTACGNSGMYGHVYAADMGPVFENGGLVGLMVGGALSGPVWHGHHTVPRAILNQLPPALAGQFGTREHIWRIPQTIHEELHYAAPGMPYAGRGGLYRLRWEQEIAARGGVPALDARAITEIRDMLVEEFGIGVYRP
ncbi:MAG TPA: RHS repeat-associated core domain-containing protein [Chloroflexota bacterium]|nr:RHS repeat-associated core domain-containing protein [Chloroflexota bacterium]